MTVAKEIERTLRWTVRYLKPGTLIALARSTKKVAMIVGPSKVDDKIRVRIWSHNQRKWSSPRAEPIDNVIGIAPEDWPQTRAARKVQP